MTGPIYDCAVCAVCGAQIPDPAERWPSAAAGIVCQVCWEAQSSRLWWAMVQCLEELGEEE
jgi:hypothetical protein